MKVGEIVRVLDGSYTLEIKDNKLEATSGTSLVAEGSFIIIATNCSLPGKTVRLYWDKHAEERNDTIIKSISSDRIVFIQKRFLTSVHKCNICPNCGQKI